MRILHEAQGMRARGHDLVFVVQKGGGLVRPLREAGFVVYELHFTKKRALPLIKSLWKIMRTHKIEVINTHSSVDSWIAGFLGKILKKKVVRTRHLSTAVRPGLNSRLLYNFFASHVVTTCKEVVPMLQKQAKLSSARISSIPTGIDPTKLKVDPKAATALREQFGFKKDDVVVGTLCIFRGWKGIADLLHAAKLLEEKEEIKFLLVGSGVSEPSFRELHKRLGLEKKVFFAGHLSPPFDALAAMDIFALLSWAHEGVSQASLQAAYLQKPLITTTIGGLKEVCLHGHTGLQVPVQSPEAVAEAIELLAGNPQKRKMMGKNAKKLVEQEFLFETMITKMERVYGCR